MMLNQGSEADARRVEKIAVVGAGIVGIPMAAALARAKIRIGVEEPASVVIIQRGSPTSGWKVGAINSGSSPLGGIEPGLDEAVKEGVSEGLLRASHDYADLRDADVILVCVQTDKKGFEPDYGPLFAALDSIAAELQQKPARKVPLLVFESTLAPTTMSSVISPYFERKGLADGRDILLANSPNRVMPGRLLERIQTSDKLIGGLTPLAAECVRMLYSQMVTGGRLHTTNSLTAELVKVLENAYRDVRIAYASEIARYCDERDIDYYRVRDEVNQRLFWEDSASGDPNAVPTGGLLIPTLGVGGHCLPKDGILLLWRRLEAGYDTAASVILEARRINDESPALAFRRADKHFGPLSGKRITLLGAAYRFDSEDTRNSPSFKLASRLLENGCRVVLHDPFVRPDDPNLRSTGLAECFTRELEPALEGAACVFLCTAHRFYRDNMPKLLEAAKKARGIFDGCNLFHAADLEGLSPDYTGIGRGKAAPPAGFEDFVFEGFKCLERAFANEISDFIRFANHDVVEDDFNRVEFAEVKRLAGTCATGCGLGEPGSITVVPGFEGYVPRIITGTGTES